MWIDKGPPLLTWIIFNPPWINGYTHYNVSGEITYPFPNFNSAAIEVWFYAKPLSLIHRYDLGPFYQHRLTLFPA